MERKTPNGKKKRHKKIFPSETEKKVSEKNLWL